MSDPTGRARTVHGALRPCVDEHVLADPAHRVHLQPRDVGDRSYPRIAQRRRPGAQQLRRDVREHPVHPVRLDERPGQPRAALEQHVQHAAIVQCGEHRVRVAGAQCSTSGASSASPDGMSRCPTTTRSG